MVTYFNKKDMIAFANHCLSDERSQRVIDGHHQTRIEDNFKTNLQDALKSVSHADFENWKGSVNKT